MAEISSDISLIGFDSDIINKLAKQVIESVIGNNAYAHSKVNAWSNSVVEQVLANLMKINRPFKYVVSCVIVQKNGAGLHTATSCYWDNTTDGHTTVRWENKSIHCIVQVFGIAI